MEMSNYHIDSDKLQQVIDIYTDEYEPKASNEDIEGFILADWPEGQEHQDWLDTADTREIADWIALDVFGSTD
jgi:hypothetical protein